MIRVIVESPFKAPTLKETARNIRYVRACMRDCLLRGESPYASHALYTLPGVLRDDVPLERKMGMEAGWAWIATGDMTAVYTDLGTSSGMQSGIDLAKKQGRTVVERQLGPNWDHPEGDEMHALSEAVISLIADVDDAMRDVDPAVSWDGIKKRALKVLKVLGIGGGA